MSTCVKRVLGASLLVAVTTSQAIVLTKPIRPVSPPLGTSLPSTGGAAARVTPEAGKAVPSIGSAGRQAPSLGGGAGISASPAPAKSTPPAGSTPGGASGQGQLSVSFGSCAESQRICRSRTCTDFERWRICNPTEPGLDKKPRSAP